MVLAQTLPKLYCYCFSSLPRALVLSKLVPMAFALSKVAKSLVNKKKKVLKKTAMKKDVDYTNMKKKDIPCGHYFKWIEFHNNKFIPEHNERAKLANQTKKKL
jgi:hypothetical protein